MAEAATREFQVFAKPGGPMCNLGCEYCYYLKKGEMYPAGESFRMPDDLLDQYIRRHIEASPSQTIRFSWHGGEPTMLGLDYFRKIVSLQRKYQPPGRRIANGIQTNGTLLDEEWCRFLAAERFFVGLSLDGPRELHDLYRVAKSGLPTHDRVMNAYRLLRTHGVFVDLLCVIHAENVRRPVEVYGFFKEIGATHLTFLPLVERVPGVEGGVSERSVPAEAWGDFLCEIFNRWVREDIGRIKVQIFEEAAGFAFGREPSLCILRKTCGDIPVIEHNGDFYCCDHFVDSEHRLGNIGETPLVELLESPAQRAFGQAKQETLPRSCRVCDVLAMCNGGCPKDRFLETPDSDMTNWLCAGYKRFFTHCRPFVAQLAALWRGQTGGEHKTGAVRPTDKIGRNDPCPCGSGKKFKKCCLNKEMAGTT